MDSLIPKAKQSLNVIQQAFAAKRIDFLDVIYAERTLLEFQLSSEIVSRIWLEQKNSSAMKFHVMSLMRLL
jgi:outer membrane protein TolC